MIRMTTVNRPTEIIAEIRCDLCGGEIVDKGCGYGYANLIADWGYDSSHDGDRVRLQVCEKCVYEKILPMRMGGDA